MGVGGMKNPFGMLMWNMENAVRQIHLHTCYHPSAILVYSYPCCLALEDVIPTKRESEERIWAEQEQMSKQLLTLCSSLCRNTGLGLFRWQTAPLASQHNTTLLTTHFYCKTLCVAVNNIPLHCSIHGNREVAWVKLPSHTRPQSFSLKEREFQRCYGCIQTYFYTIWGWFLIRPSINWTKWFSNCTKLQHCICLEEW